VKTALGGRALVIFASKFFPISFAIFSVHEGHLIATGDIDRFLAELYK